MPATQKQIAERLGVHQTLVAKALQGNPRVSPERRALILKTAEEMGYGAQSNIAARTMRLRREGERFSTGTIAVLMGTFLEGLPLPQLPFFRELLEGIHEEVTDRGVHAATYYIPRSGTLPRAITEGGVDGVISLYSLTNEQKLSDVDLKVPFVKMGGATEQWNLRPDDNEGIYQVTRHLLEQGHTEIAYIGDTSEIPFLFSDGERFQGFQRAMSEFRIGVNPDLLVHVVDPAFGCGEQAMKTLLQRDVLFTAAVCLNDASALGAISALREAGVDVPGDVSITGFDGLSGGYGGSETLTTAYFDRHAMGRLAVSMIYDRDPATNSRELIPVRLLARGTTQPLQTVQVG